MAGSTAQGAVPTVPRAGDQPPQRFPRRANAVDFARRVRHLFPDMTSGTDRQPDAEEVEFLGRLFDIQRRAFLPLQWVIFALALTFWWLSRPLRWPPPPDVFALFVAYGLWLSAETYFLWISRPARRQIRPLCLFSYAADVAFVTLLVWFDSVRYAGVATGPTDFYLLYFIVLLRSFALFRTARATLLVNTLIGVLFVVNLFWQDASLPSYSLRNNLIRLAFFWVIVFMSAIIAALVNRQKAELAETREKLVRSENMALLGQLAAGVAHEINNPIGVISAYAEYLEKNAPRDDPRREDLLAIHREALRCKSIVEGLLGLARQGAAPRVSVDVHDLLEQVLALMARPAEPDRIQIDLVRPDGPLPAVTADPAQLIQALLNILLNARQSLGEGGGTIRVWAEHRPAQERLAIIVEDTGCGIAPDDLPHVFEPFYSRRQGGTGLGLAITRRIIEEHGGEIVLTSHVGAGTRVEILLPAPRHRKGSSDRLHRVE
jgi:signal transduction histidine kinase